MQDVRSALEGGRLLVADGATGTMLQSMGLVEGMIPELWNVERPDAIRALHRAYLDAGSGVILTNTFGGNRKKLDRAGGLGGRATELNRAAAELAREQAGKEAYVAGDLGPTGELLAPLGLLSEEEAIEVYAEQAEALVAAGVDLIWVETMSDLGEARAAVMGALQATDLPVFCSLSFGRGARTMMGVTPQAAAEALWPLGLTAIGANCGEGVEVITPVLSQMRNALLDELGQPRIADLPRPVFIAKPNAGLPHLEDGVTVYDLGPQDLAGHVPHFIELGAQVVGACCGSSPEHIAEISTAVARCRDSRA